MTNPTGPASGLGRAFQGGGWSDYAGGCRSADRYYNTPTYSSRSMGFRVCLQADGS